MNENIFTNLDSFEGTLSQIVEELKTMNETCDMITSHLEKMNEIGFDDVISGLSDIVSIGSGLMGMVASLEAFNKNVVKLPVLLQGIFNPTTLVIGAIGSLALAFLSLVDVEDEATKKSREFVAAENEKIEKTKELTESLRENAQATRENEEAINADYSLVLKQVDQLVKLTGTDGVVKNVGKARLLIDNINKIMPNTVELTDKNRLVWRDINGEVTNNTGLIKKNIEELKRKAIVEEYQKDYLEAIKNETNVLIEKSKAENALSEAMKRRNEIREKGNNKTDDEMYEEIVLNGSIKRYTSQINACNEQLLAIQDSTNNYNAAQKMLSGTTEDMADFMVEKYTKLNLDGTKNWQSLGEGILALDAQLQAHEDKVVLMTDTEKQASEDARTKICDDLVKEASQYQMSYEDMLTVLSNEGVKLNEEEEKLLKESYDKFCNNETNKQTALSDGMDLLKSLNNAGLKDLNDDTETMLKNAETLFKDSGNASGLELCDNLVKCIQENHGEINEEAKKIMVDIENEAKKADPEMNMGISTGAAMSTISKLKKAAEFNADAKIGLTQTVKGVGIGSAFYAMKIYGFANGGFPELMLIIL